MKLKTFIIAVIAIISFACSQKQVKEAESKSASPVEMVYHVEGMTCDHCEMSIQKSVNSLDGVTETVANHEDSTTRVVYDPLKTDEKQIVAAIEKRGYKVVQ